MSNNDSIEANDEDTRIEIVFFKSDTCAFCPRAEEVLLETIGDFEENTFRLETINVSKNPEKGEEYGVFALPTIMIGGVSVTGIPEPGMIFKMILGAKARQRRGAK
ncbi:MAG: hypothetical protein BAJATHORv1_10252 [Candidatus Thorarchaeota archaeon]|nr:MAG: hypothetical protein BAJATHORv1_10252 [Candidatus Thorarchaeota archaeon]